MANEKIEDSDILAIKEILKTLASLGKEEIVMLILKEEYTRFVLEKTLREVLARWSYECQQGDGIHEDAFDLYNRAFKLVNNTTHGRQD